jgi:hypothetical protein
MAKKEGGGGDELDMLKATILKKDLEVITITDKMKRVEERSVSILGSLEKLRNGATEKILSLTDIINFLTRYHSSIFNLCYSMLDEKVVG